MCAILTIFAYMLIRDTDIHSHLLPGVDDGFKTAEESLEAIAAMARAGCREFVFTPHMNPDVYPESTESGIIEVYNSFVKRIPAELGVKTSLAAEYMVVKDFEKRIAEHPETLLTYGGPCTGGTSVRQEVPEKDSILIEMSYFFGSNNLRETIFQLGLVGLSPILAHPERYAYMAGDLEQFDVLRDMGCRFQCNYLSLTGVYGPTSIRILRYLAKRGWIDYFSSDLHSITQFQRISDSKVVLPLRLKMRKLGF